MQELQSSRNELKAKQQDLAHASLCSFASSAAREFDELRMTVRDEVDAARLATDQMREEKDCIQKQLDTVSHAYETVESAYRKFERE